MSVRLEISEYADADLTGIEDYIKFHLSAPKAASKASALILDAMHTLSDFPESGTAVMSPDGYRTPYRVLICEKHYAISYAFDRNTQKVWVYRVFHTTQDWLALLLGRGSGVQKEQD